MAFQTTRWSLVAHARGDGAEGARALDELCATYWPAVYALYRREGHGPHEAGDLTQGLFADLLARGDLSRADRERGRFRTFLLACARNWAPNEHARATADKRGGAVVIVPLELEQEEVRLGHEPTDRLDAAALFDRRWAQMVIERALDGLQQHELERGREQLFALLRPVLEGEAPERPWAELAATLGTTEGALKGRGAPSARAVSRAAAEWASTRLHSPSKAA